MPESLLTYRKLYNHYSPLKTNKSLVNIYESIVKKDFRKNDIRFEINNLILNNYWNESVIKSAFVRQHLIQKSPRLNITIFELNAGSSRADIAVINGRSHVYEIKTEYDSFERLNKQMNDYENLFDYLHIIIPKEKVNIALESLDESVGIIYYYKNRLGNINFKTYRNSKLNKRLNPYEQLMTFTKSELLGLIKQSNNYSLVKQDIVYSLMTQMRPDQINELYREYTKDKYRKQWQFLYQNIHDIFMLDYQWFFKNNLDTKKVYR